MSEPVAVNVRIGLDEVMYWRVHDMPPERARVDKVWTRMGEIPGLDVCILETGKTERLVPHASSVSGALGHYWTFTRKGDECPARMP